MAVQLTISDLRCPENTYVRSFTQERIMLGRSKGCDVCLPDLTVSTQHVEIRLQRSTYVAVDMGSMNGTLVGDKKIVSNSPKKLTNGDELEISCYRVTFRLGVALKGRGSDESTTQARAMLASVLKGEEIEQHPVLVVTNGPGKALSFKLEKEPTVRIIGRSRQADIQLDDRDVSRHHAEVEYVDGQVTIRNKSGRNGLFFKGDKTEEFTLQQGDSFRLGQTTMALEHPVDPRLQIIQNSPEDETSSFSPSEIKEVHSRQRRDTISPPFIANPGDRDGEPGDEKNGLPVGPEDPLQSAGDLEYARTKEIPGYYSEEKSDIALIIVGAILVLCCVGGLIWVLS